MRQRLLVIAVVLGAAAACANIAGIAGYEIVDRDGSDATATTSNDDATTVDGARRDGEGAIDGQPATDSTPMGNDVLVGDAGSDADVVVFPPRSVKCGGNGLECSTFCCHPITTEEPTCGDAGDSATCPSQTLRYECDEPADCPNQICCGERYELSGQVYVISGRCAPTCSGPIFCTAQSDCSDGGQCKATMSNLPSPSAKACL